ATGKRVVGGPGSLRVAGLAGEGEASEPALGPVAERDELGFIGGRRDGAGVLMAEPRGERFPYGALRARPRVAEREMPLPAVRTEAVAVPGGQLGGLRAVPEIAERGPDAGGHREQHNGHLFVGVVEGVERRSAEL